MGRHKIYMTEEEQKAAQRKWNNEYYAKNKEIINKKRMDRYYELQKNPRSDNIESEKPDA